jgi:hypothetical protein
MTISVTTPISRASEPRAVFSRNIIGDAAGPPKFPASGAHRLAVMVCRSTRPGIGFPMRRANMLTTFPR